MTFNDRARKGKEKRGVRSTSTSSKLPKIPPLPPHVVEEILHVANKTKVEKGDQGLPLGDPILLHRELTIRAILRDQRLRDLIRDEINRALSGQDNKCVPEIEVEATAVYFPFARKTFPCNFVLFTANGPPLSEPGPMKTVTVYLEHDANVETVKFTSAKFLGPPRSAPQKEKDYCLFEIDNTECPKLDRIYHFVSEFRTTRSGDTILMGEWTTPQRFLRGD